jgi:hypothetical protein
MTKILIEEATVKLALKALETLVNGSGFAPAENIEKAREAITAINQARSAPVQEPVAWIYSQGAAKVVSMNYVPGVRATPLYTSPPAARQWVGLTEQEAAECWSTSTVRTWQAIEAKLKEKNNG